MIRDCMCPCGNHDWSLKDERRLKALNCLETEYVREINQLRRNQWCGIEKQSINKPSICNGESQKTCNPGELKPPEKYPDVLSPYSLCWWQQPDPVFPPLHTGLISRYGFKYKLPCTPENKTTDQLQMKSIIPPAKIPVFDRVPKIMSIYWDHPPARTEYEDNFSYTGYLLLRGAKQYAEPIPSSRLWKDERRTYVSFKF